jgi:cob(I)alamin adenosyltransferase
MIIVVGEPADAQGDGPKALHHDAWVDLPCMIRLDRITTRSGDRGTTGLADGTRVTKHHPLICAIGAVDEVNSLLGLVRNCPLPDDVAQALPEVQNDLFDLGADLAVPPGGPHEDHVRRISDRQIQRLEELVACSADKVAPLTSFVLPGGSQGAAWLHLARTVARRAERDLSSAIAADTERPWNPNLIRYLNRLSDCCFVWSRRANDDGKKDVAWRPGAGH